MLLGMVAFVQEGVIITASQAAAAGGWLPEPAVTLSKSVHLHGDLAGNVHHHGGDNGDGHAHTGRNGDDTADTPEIALGSLACTTGLLPAPLEGGVYLQPGSRVGLLPAIATETFEPEGPKRPPSTPSIA